MRQRSTVPETALISTPIPARIDEFRLLDLYLVHALPHILHDEFGPFERTARILVWKLVMPGVHLDRYAAKHAPHDGVAVLGNLPDVCELLGGQVIPHMVGAAVEIIEPIADPRQRVINGVSHHATGIH